ncbi:ABC transporter ATP-binding protein [Fusibacter paucivorans]|uniref:ABC transporter ATP-binding protein n=1 Tax=Fusibacter paucivorans TaxID=76009 RepID=A0ABS5PJV9_9FIRM|nr:ABC transporter ATP-binding protein [Fusibacter paucivorans]MBS7525374.1 ABC transporter ATP-binding protein [Fusibacter paucivorans]
MKPLLSIENLAVAYQTDLETVAAVNGISFAIHKGQTLGIVGETGAGKTTTALSILRLLPDRTGIIKSGKIEFEGEDLLTYSERAMRKVRGEKVAMIFQDPMTALNPVIPIGKQIAEALILHNPDGMSRDDIEDRVDASLKMVGISPQRKGDYPHQFSGGMKQRVIIAIALACKPKLIIADEPTTALDVTIQAQVLQMINDLKSELQTAMIMITHDLGIVAQTCDEVAVMYAGEIVEYGMMEDIFDAPVHHPYTVGLFGSIPSLDQDVERLYTIDGLMPDPTNLPVGCKFMDRCPKVMPICQEAPKTYTISGKHQIKCHLFSDIAQSPSDSGKADTNTAEPDKGANP